MMASYTLCHILFTHPLREKDKLATFLLIIDFTMCCYNFNSRDIVQRQAQPAVMQTEFCLLMMEGFLFKQTYL